MRILLAQLLFLILAIPLQAQTFTVLHSFDLFVDGASPYGGLLLNGPWLYGTVNAGGPASNPGGLFKISVDGTGFNAFRFFTPETNGTNSDGGAPLSGLIFDGTFLYGTTTEGGSGAGGTVFKVDTAGNNFQTLHNFTNSLDSPGGFEPYGGVLLVGDTLLGTTEYGGTPAQPNGVLFKLATNGGGYSVTFDFNSAPVNNGLGAYPTCNLIQGVTALFGTTSRGGTSGSDWGTIFKTDTNGVLQSYVHVFGVGDGSGPNANLLLSGNTLYGTTVNGGPTNYNNGSGTVFRINTDGTGFSVLHAFTNTPEGANPFASLIIISNTLYGTTVYGGSAGYGTVFQLNTNGSGYKILKHFQNGPDGAEPYGNLTAYGNTLFGTASSGGINGFGTIFKINLGGQTAVPLNISLASNNTIKVWWLPEGGAYTLQTNANLSASSWPAFGGPVAFDGITNSVLMSQPHGDLYFRLLVN